MKDVELDGEEEKDQEQEQEYEREDGRDAISGIEDNYCPAKDVDQRYLIPDPNCCPDLMISFA